MKRKNTYYMLVCSLPHLFSLYDTHPVPISQLRLESRLKWLNETDAVILKALEDTLLWHRIPVDEKDEDIVERVMRLVTRLSSRTLKNIVDFTLVERKLISILRLRARGEGPPESGSPLAIDPFSRHIIRYYDRPAFGLEVYFPWLIPAEKAIAQKDASALEQLHSQLLWNLLQQLGEGHYFDFEAVAIYVLKWHLIDGLKHVDANIALVRFDALISKGMGHTLDTTEIE